METVSRCEHTASFGALQMQRRFREQRKANRSHVAAKSRQRGRKTRHVGKFIQEKRKNSALLR